MVEATRCPGCGAIQAEPAEAKCVTCGALLSTIDGDWNPYSAPASPLKDPIDEFTAPLTIPRSVFGKYALAFWLLGTNVVTISLIVLTVWLPLNLAIEAAGNEFPPGQELASAWRFNSIADWIFGPIVSGALISLLSRRIRGERVTYFQAMRAGFGNWGRVFAANFFANIFIALGMLALVVPGIMLQVRYSLIDPVVVLEHSPRPRERSTQLTVGRRWSIFWAYCLFFAVFLPLPFLSWALVEAVGLEELPWLSLVIDCAFDILGTIAAIVLLLYYCEARQDEEARDAIEDQGEQIIKTRLAESLRE